METIIDHPDLNLIKVAQCSGGEYAGPCPWCAGRDRFRAWPEHPSGATGGRFMCRQCERKGDGIALLMELDGMSYPEAARSYGRVLDDPRPARDRTAPAPVWSPKPPILPGDTWQRAAAGFLAECAVKLTSDGTGMGYAQGRHLTQETIQGQGLGWNPADRWVDRVAWGLDPETNPETGRPRKLWLPAGLVVPVRRKSGITGIKIRRSAWTPDDRRPKYVAVSGSSCLGMALGRVGKPVVVVESELDALLLHQECADLVSVLALGSAASKPDADVDAWLKSSPAVLIALDWDAAGRSAASWWLREYPGTILWPVPAGKDVGDLPGLEISIRDWIETGLQEVEGRAVYPISLNR